MGALTQRENIYGPRGRYQNTVNFGFINRLFDRTRDVNAQQHQWDYAEAPCRSYASNHCSSGTAPALSPFQPSIKLLPPPPPFQPSRDTRCQYQTLGMHAYIVSWLRFGSFRFAMFHFTSLRFAPPRFTPLRFAPLRFTSIRFASLCFASPCFASLCFASLRYVSIRFETRIHALYRRRQAKAGKRVSERARTPPS